MIVTLPLTLCVYACTDSLESRPVLTKAISSGLIGLLGDLTAQSIEWGFKSSPAPWSGSQVITVKALPCLN